MTYLTRKVGTVAVGAHSPLLSPPSVAGLKVVLSCIAWEVPVALAVSSSRLRLSVLVEHRVDTVVAEDCMTDPVATVAGVDPP